MASLQTDRTALLLTGICATGLGLVGLLVWMGAPADHASHSNPDSEPDRATSSTDRQGDQSRGHLEVPPSKKHPQPSSTDSQRQAPGSRNPTTKESAERSDNQESARPNRSSNSATEKPNPENQPSKTNSPPSDAGRASNTGDTDARNQTGYQDPVNQRVLGPRSWLATPDDATAEQIDRELSKDVENPTRYAVSDQDRSRALNKMHAIAEECAATHLSAKIRGHVVIRATLVVSNSRARLNNVRLDDVLRLEDANFQTCIVQRTRDITFDASRDGSLTIATGYKH